MKAFSVCFMVLLGCLLMFSPISAQWGSYMGGPAGRGLLFISYSEESEERGYFGNGNRGSNRDSGFGGGPRGGIYAR